SAALILASSPVFRRATFRDNVTTLAGYDGAGAVVDGGAPRFEDCLFENLHTRHELAGGGGGVDVRGDAVIPAHPAFAPTPFRGNTANEGGGALVGGPVAHALFLGCRFEGNRALAGGGLGTYGAAVTVVASEFVANRAETFSGCCGFGGGISLSGPWEGER